MRSRSTSQPLSGRRTEPDARRLRGRDRELLLLEEFVRLPTTCDNALLVVGERGSGKSALLDRVGARAGEELAVAAAHGDGSPVGSGASVLEQLDHAVAGHGTTVVSSPLDEERLLLATSVLRSVLRVAAPRPLLLVVDDLHLADPLSAFVCAFVARRLRGTRALFLAAVSPPGAEAPPWDWAASHRLSPLSPAACDELLGDAFPGMVDSVRHRVLAEAHGNPARLLEIGASLSEEQLLGLRRLPGVPGVPVRLEDGSDAVVASLPAPTLRLLLLAALESTGDIRAVRAAASQDNLGLDAFAAAEKARLVTLDVRRQTVVFPDPAVRAAVIARATAAERRSAHRRLAWAAADPEREAWHRAEALDGPDGTVALELDGLARRALAIGDRDAAVDMLLKASEVAASASHRSDLLALAAHVRSRSRQDRTDAPTLTRGRSDRPPPDRPRSTATAAYLSLTEGLDPEEVFQFVMDGIGDSGPLSAKDPELIELCYILLSCGLLAASPALWHAYRDVLHRIGPELPDALRILSEIAPDVARIDPRSLQELDDALDHVSLEGDPYAVLRLGIAAFPVDRLGQCRDALWHLTHTSSTGGPALAAAVEAKLRLCLDDTTTGQWDEALDLAAEGVDLCDRYGLDIQGHTFRLCQAVVAASRGEQETAAALAATLSAWALPRGVRLVELQSSYARTVAALGSGDFEAAYQQASSISRAGTLAPYNGQAVWVCLDLVEAAVHTGRLPEAVAHTEAILDSSIPLLSPRLAQRAATAQALTATSDDEAAGHFQRALALTGADRWVFDTARTQLLYGERLRRTSDAALARSQLTSSLVRFQALGANPWTARAAAGLRATGVPSLRETPDPHAVLTARELTIASMAAAGLTNKEIGSHLFLSHRTVASLLYKVFPKLGVTSRAALRDALAAGAAGGDGSPHSPTDGTVR